MNINNLKNKYKYKLTDALLFLITGSLFAWGVVCAAANCLGFTPDYGETLLRVIIIILIMRVVFINKYTVIAALTIIFLTAGVTFITLRSEPYFAGAIEKALDFIYNFCRYIGGYTPYELSYETAAIWILCVASSLFSVAFAGISFRFYVLSGLTAAVFIAALSSGGLSYELPFLACIFCELFFLVKYLSAKPSVKKSFSLSAAVLVLLCFAAVYFIPVPKQGFADELKETVVYKPIQAANKLIGEFFAPKYFSLSSTGYLRKDGKLGGDIILTDEIVLEIAFSERWLDKPLYFAGAAKDKYTGYSWENTAPDNEPVYFSDYEPPVEFLELMFSNIMISLEMGEFEEIVKVLENPEKLLNTWYAERCEYIPGGTLTLQMEQTLYKRKTAEINIRGPKTYSVFAPSRIVDAEKEDGQLPVLKDGQDNLTSEILLPKNSSYTVSFRADPSDSYWNSISSLSRKGIYTEILNYLKKLHEKYNFNKNQVSVLLDSSLDEDKGNMHMFKMYPAGEEYFNPKISMNYEDLLTQVFIPRANDIYARYTQLPAGFPARIADLAYDVIKDAENDYSKAKAIASFLRKYPYTLTPGEVPEDRDFVDYFLFDGQTGYCTYYASAFVTMCRAVGLPARYVEGYVTPLKKDEDGYYKVTNKQGHAWGEVYFEGYGWVQFEPTPSANIKPRTVALPTPEQYPLSQSDPGITVISVASDPGGIAATENNGDSTLAVPEIQEPVNSGEKNVRNIIIYNFIISISILIAAILIFLYIRFLIIRRTERKIGEKENNEAAALYFNMILKYLKFFRREKDPYETIAQYAERIGGEMSEISEILSRALYGKEQISGEEINSIKRAFKNMDDIMRRSVGSIRYIYYRYAARIV